MPFDYEPIGMEAYQYQEDATWLERYLMGFAYNSFKEPRVSVDYYTLDQTTPSYEMRNVVNRLNGELRRLHLTNIPREETQTIKDLIKAIRTVLKNAGSNRIYPIDFLVGNQNPLYWEIANNKNVWQLSTDELYQFCKDVKHLAAQQIQSNQDAPPQESN